MKAESRPSGRYGGNVKGNTGINGWRMKGTAEMMENKPEKRQVRKRNNFVESVDELFLGSSERKECGELVVKKTRTKKGR
jgi:hypothetical protein